MSPTISVWFPNSCRKIYSLSGSDALETVIDLFNRRLQISIREGEVDQGRLVSVLSSLTRLGLSQIIPIRKACLSWITDILNSRYTAEERYRMAGKVVELVWEEVKPGPPQRVHLVRPVWVPPLLEFLQLGEKFYSTESPSTPDVLALRILSISSGYRDFTPAMSQILTSTLLPTHPLRSRRSALKVFQRFISGWLSPQMENVSNEDRANLLRAVDDLFQFTADPPLQDGQQVTNDYEPTETAVVLIEFASSVLWRGHLRRSNFTSCEEIVSMEEGKKSTLRYILDTATKSCPGFLSTPAKIIAAIERLEGLQCPNTTEVVLMWAWTLGVTDAVDYDAWKPIEYKTLEFYRHHGIGRLQTLSRHVMDDTAPRDFLKDCRWEPWCRGKCVGLPVWIAVAQACQLRRLYRLFGCDPTMWKGVVVGEKVDEGVGVSVGRRRRYGIPVQLMDCVCDYP